MLPLVSAPSACSLAWLGCSLAPNPLEYHLSCCKSLSVPQHSRCAGIHGLGRKSHKSCSRHSAALTPRLWHPTVLVFTLRAPPLLHLVLGLAIPSWLLPTIRAVWERILNGAETPRTSRWDACDVHGVRELGAGFGYLRWVSPGLAALLLLMCHGVKDVIQQGELSFSYGSAAFACPSAVLWMVALLAWCSWLPSERQICGILVDASRSWRLARAAGTLRPAFPFSGALHQRIMIPHLTLICASQCRLAPNYSVFNVTDIELENHAECTSAFNSSQHLVSTHKRTHDHFHGLPIPSSLPESASRVTSPSSAPSVDKENGSNPSIIVRFAAFEDRKELWSWRQPVRPEGAWWALIGVSITKNFPR
ncbi:hypothetical protein DFH08DRAFT_827310 [Mycena albidolilacea]|uniref:Uncharacterized protein n=1 Tax=Mycena albidolilacea TaxID=1033008 RepID=A0AAD7E810_9AGAR|nr:hypothetical protein DFH08DRAFT_827310 [Mycena albidolilacea]